MTAEKVDADVVAVVCECGFPRVAHRSEPRSYAPRGAIQYLPCPVCDLRARLSTAERERDEARTERDAVRRILRRPEHGLRLEIANLRVANGRLECESRSAEARGFEKGVRKAMTVAERNEAECVAVLTEKQSPPLSTFERERVDAQREAHRTTVADHCDLLLPTDTWIDGMCPRCFGIGKAG